MSLKEPGGRLARWMVEVQDFEFVVKYTPGSTMVVPDSLSRDEVRKPLCQRRFGEIESAGDTYEAAGDIEEPTKPWSLLGVPSPEKIRSAQEKECAEELRVARNGGGETHHRPPRPSTHQGSRTIWGRSPSLFGGLCAGICSRVETVRSLRPLSHKRENCGEFLVAQLAGGCSVQGEGRRAMCQGKGFEACTKRAHAGLPSLTQIPAGRC